MYKLFINEVGELFSWEGAKGKQKFKNLKIAEVIMAAVRRNKQTCNATDSEIIQIIKKWLVRCTDRKKLGIKKRR